MNVRMPDGTIVTNVPDGTSQDELTSMLYERKRGAAVQQGKRDLADSQSFGDAALIGAGKFGDSAWAGLKQIGTGLVGAAANALPDSTIKRSLEDYATAQAGAIDQDQQDKLREYAVLADRRPFATGLGEGAAMMAVPGASAVRGAKGAEMLMQAGAAGAVPGLIGYGTMEEKGGAGLAGAAGGVLGGALGAGIGRAIQPFRPAMNEVRTAAMDAAERFGLKLTPAEITGNRALKWAQAAIDDLPFASGMGTARRAENAAALNRAALADVGEVGTQITDKTLAGAKTRLGGEFENAFKAERVQLTDDTVGKLAQINQDALRFLPDEKAKVVTNRIEQILGKIERDDAIPGLAYQKWRVEVKSKDGDTNHYLQQVRSAIDEAASNSLSEGKMEAFKNANRQYAALKTLLQGNVVNRETGNVMPKQLDSALASRYGDAYKTGQLTGNLPDVAKAGMLLREMPNSGTAPRMAYSGGMGGGGLGVATGLIDPLTLGAAAATPALAQMAMNNPLARRYTSKGLFAVTPEMERWLIRAGAYPGAGAAMSLSGPK
jgi:hypothetical protein